MKQYIPFLKKDPVVAVIRMAGVIASGGRGLNDAAMAAVIERAFARGKPVAVALVINSPGGAPVQTALMAARVRRLAVDRSGAVAISSLGITGIILVTLAALVFASLTSVLDRRMSAQSTMLKASEERHRRLQSRCRPRW